MESESVGTYIPLFCLLSALATIVVSLITKKEEKFKWPLVPLGLSIGFMLIMFIPKVWVATDVILAIRWFSVGMPLGVLFASCSGLGLSSLAKIVVGAGAVGFVFSSGQGLMPDASASESLAMAAGLGVGVSLLALIKPGVGCYDIPIIGVMTILVNSLGALAFSEMHKLAGVLVVAGVVAACLIGMAVTKAMKGKAVFGVASAVVVFVLSVWYWGSVFFGKIEFVMSGLAGVVVALVCCWVVSKEGDRKSLPFALGTFLWLGVATYAFSQLHGYGMAFAALAGVLTMLLLDRRDVLVTVSPLIALSFYRLFSEIFPNSTRALDIGQHYGLLGLLVGIAVVIVVMESLEKCSDVEGLKARGASALTGVLALGVVLAATVFLGEKGSVGLLVGLCLGPAVKSLGSKVTAGSVALSLVLVAAYVVAYPSVTSGVELDHDGKQILVLWTGGLVIVFGGLAAWLAAPIKEEKNAA